MAESDWVAMLTSASVTSPEMIGLLAWWSVVLAGPVVIVRRRRRRGAAPRAKHARLRLPRPRCAHRRGAAPATAHPPTPPASGEASEALMERSPAPSCEAAGEWLGQMSPSGGVRVLTNQRGATRSHPPPVAPGRLAPETLEPLCRYVDFRRRLGLAVSELQARLAQLPADRWRIEPYPLTGERRNTLLVVGETGVFVISATYAPGHWDDVIAVNRLAGKIQFLLPGYSGAVQAAVCHPFTAIRPRMWHRPDEHGDWVGAWLIGGDSVLEWLKHFGPEHGLEAADLARFDELAKPNWLRGAIPTPASWPPIREATVPDSQE